MRVPQDAQEIDVAKTATTRTLDQVIAERPEGERAKIAVRARELIAKEISLQRLRKAVGETQTVVAKRFKIR